MYKYTINNTRDNIRLVLVAVAAVVGAVDLLVDFHHDLLFLFLLEHEHGVDFSAASYSSSKK